jgi:predicted alpha/beta-fold hydrolase
MDYVKILLLLFFYCSCYHYYLQESHNCILSGAVSLCNPFNLPIADEDFHKGFNNVYDHVLARGLRRILKK